MTGPLQFTLVDACNQTGLSLLSTLHEKAFVAQGEKAWNADDFLQIVASTGAVAVIAHAGDQAVGFAVWRTILDEAELITIGVLPALRGRGHGAELIRHMCENLRKTAVLKLFLEVRADNESAIKLYRTAGFEEIGKRRRYYQTHSGNRVDALCLMLILNNPANAK